MSVKNEESKNLKEEVVVDQNETTELVVKEEETVKQSKVKTIAKTALKVAGVGAVGLLGFILGAKCSKKSDDDEEEIIEAEIIDEE